MFRQALDVAWPVCAIGVALISVFSSLVKTDERRSSVTLWDRSAQPRTPHKSHLPEKSRWRRTPFAGVPFGTVCPDGKHKRPSSLIRYHGSFWAGSGQTAFGSINPQSGTSASDPLRDTLPTLSRSKTDLSGLIRPRWSVSRDWKQHKTARWH